MKIRVISAVILLPLVVAAIWAGNWPFALLVAIAAFLACIEYVQMLRRKGHMLSLPLILAMTGLWLADVLWGEGRWLAPGIAVLVFLSSAWVLYRRSRNPTEENLIAQWAMTVAGGMYLGLGAAYLLRLRALPDGLWWTLTALPVVWVGDSAAYIFGRKWGRHKMAPTISPGKSWEGYASGVAGGMLIGLFLGWLWPTLAGHPLSLNLWKGLFLGGVLSTITTTGDFFVSLIKREVEVKDTGKLIPGHGGVFDRIDSLLWTGFITWVIASLLG
jgi:phosphatidate cytidylyltransferase